MSTSSEDTIGHSAGYWKRQHDALNEKYIDVCKHRDELLRTRAGLRADLAEAQELIGALQDLLEKHIQPATPPAVQFVEMVRQGQTVKQ